MQVILGDASDYWETEIANACERIVVFTPYLDSLLVEYFEDCELPYHEITLVTQIDRIDSRGENQQRLAHLINLKLRGVDVRILDRLHAKVLIVDDWSAYFGSQNFTRYSTENYEITTKIFNESGFESVFEELEEWLENSYTPTIDDLVKASGNTIILTLDDD